MLFNCEFLTSCHYTKFDSCQCAMKLVVGYQPTFCLRDRQVLHAIVILDGFFSFILVFWRCIFGGWDGDEEK